MSKVGILGGTFNPIHNGHIMLARKALNEYGLDKVLIMPSGVSYFKANMNVLPAENRIEMAKLAIENEKDFVLDIRETKRPGNTYTYETLRELKMEYPQDELFFIVGADTLFSITTWKNVEAIFDSCIILAAVRGAKTADNVIWECKKLSEKYGADIRFLHLDAIDISSSKIRELIKENQDVSDMLPVRVYNYIKSEGLYT